MFRIAPKHATNAKEYHIARAVIFNSKLRFVPGSLTHQDRCIVSFFTLSGSSFFLSLCHLPDKQHQHPHLGIIAFLFSPPDARVAADNMYSGKGLAVFHNQMPRTLLPSKQLVFISVLLGETCGD